MKFNLLKYAIQKRIAKLSGVINVKKTLRERMEDDIVRHRETIIATNNAIRTLRKDIKTLTDEIVEIECSISELVGIE